MAIPDVSLTIKDGALGLGGPSSTNTQLKIGVSQKGTVRTIYSFSDIQNLYDTLGDGPLTEAAAQVLAIAGGPVLCMPATQTTPGSSGAVTHVGTGTSVMSVTSGVAYDSYSVIASIVTAGASLGAGTAQMQISLDGGLTYGPTVAIPVSGVYAIPNSNVTVTFAAGTFVVGDTYTFTTTAPAYNTTELTACMTAALALTNTWFLVHAVGPAASAAGAASAFSTLDTSLTTAANQFRYARGLIEVPSDTDANISTAFATSFSTRVGAAIGFANTISPINGRQMSRSSGWDAAARASQVPPSEDLGRVATGSCPGLTAVSRDERNAAGMDAQGFTTLRTIIGRGGFYLTGGRLRSSPGSDFQFLQYGRIMDIGCATTRDALLTFLNTAVRVDASGHILEKDARSIEAFVSGKLNVALLQPADNDGPGYASSLTVAVDRTNNILTSQTLNVTIRITPKGYAKTIAVSIGFSNPALQVAAA